jgi:hypothetical protein
MEVLVGDLPFNVGEELTHQASSLIPIFHLLFL